MTLTKQDAMELLQIFKEFHAESRSNHLPLDLHVCLEALRSYMASSDAFVEFYRKDNKIVGLIVGALVPLFFSSEKQAQDLVFYIQKEHRGGSWFYKATRRFEAWAKEKGACQVVVYHDTGIQTDKAVPLMTKLNYEQTGYCFSKDIICVE